MRLDNRRRFRRRLAAERRLRRLRYFRESGLPITRTLNAQLINSS